MSRTTASFLALAVFLLPTGLQAQDDVRITPDVVYGHKDGMALTMDVFTPNENANGAGVVFCVSGGWHSAHRSINPGFYAEFIKRGYTVFAVVHGSHAKGLADHGERAQPQHVDLEQTDGIYRFHVVLGGDLPPVRLEQRHVECR